MAPRAKADARLWLAGMAMMTGILLGYGLSLFSPQVQGATIACPPPSADGTPKFSISNYGLRGPIQWDALPPHVQDEFTLGGRFPVGHWFLNELQLNNANVAVGNFSRASLESFIEQARSRDENLCFYGPVTCQSLYNALDAYPVPGKSALVVGTQKPWIEAILVASGTGTTTVDFNPPILDHPDMRSLGVPELDNYTGPGFDAIFSYSSLEHDGLGRYTDPLNPNGDLERMQKMAGLLAPHGMLYLGVPTGRDRLLFNAHRIYGAVRYPLLMKGWRMLDAFYPTAVTNFNDFFDFPTDSNKSLGQQPWTIWQKI